MALTTKLDLRQGQHLVMTPQLQQAIRLLQLSNLELGAYVEAELERNPLLERTDSEPPADPAETRSEDDAGGSDEGAGEGGLKALDEAMDEPSGSAVSEVDAGTESLYPDAAPGDLATEGPMPGDHALGQAAWSGTGNRGAGGFEDEEASPETYLTHEPTLKEHLTQQLDALERGPVFRMIALYLIDLVDEAGYIAFDPLDLSVKLGASERAIDDVLAELQSFDPPGVFARTLAECMALQLKDQDRLDPQISRFLENLHLLGSHQLAMLKRLVGCDDGELKQMVAEIRKLNPKPGLKFGFEPIQPVVPDVLVRQRADGTFIVELNSSTLPRVLVNRSYYAFVSKSTQDGKEKDYLTDCLANANWLVKSLDQRARTILKVAEEIVRQQDGFFAHGVEHLRPLNLKTVADAIKMHESTVSRVTSNKYIATPRGIFELKYFFTSAIASAEAGESHSSEAVRHRIKQMIDAEGQNDVLSDDKLVERLKAEGIDIARRTVAKYREGMRIASSVERRRQRRLIAETQA